MEAYLSDLSDDEWRLLEPLLPKPHLRGRPWRWPLRSIVNAMFYLVKGGIPWRLLPREYPPWKTVYHWMRRWRRDGTWRSINAALRARVRQHEGRNAQPSAGSLDSQSIRSSGVGGPERGYDGAKRLSGRKRHILVDTTGLVLHAHVHSASLHDRDGGKLLLDPKLREELPRLEVIWADQGYAGQFAQWVRKERGYQLTVTYHRDRQLWYYGFKEKPKGFLVIPRRWVVERTFAWLGQARRLSKDYERLPETSETMIYAAMSRLMLRRLARQPT